MIIFHVKIFHFGSIIDFLINLDLDPNKIAGCLPPRPRSLGMVLLLLSNLLGELGKLLIEVDAVFDLDEILGGARGVGFVNKEVGGHIIPKGFSLKSDLNRPHQFRLMSNNQRLQKIIDHSFLLRLLISTSLN